MHTHFNTVFTAHGCFFFELLTRPPKKQEHVLDTVREALQGGVHGQIGGERQ